MGLGSFVAAPIGAALVSGLTSLAVSVLTMYLWPLCHRLQSEASAAD